MAGVLDRTSAQDAKTAAVFAVGAQIQIRYKLRQMEYLVNVNCLGVQDNRGEITIKWTEEAARQSAPPPYEHLVNLHLIQKGVLYVVTAKVAEVATGRLPRVRLSVEPTCRVFPLRQHQRYAILGRLQLGPSLGNYTYTQNVPHPMNISLGGFGVELPPQPYEIGTKISFILDIFVDSDGHVNECFPSFKLRGEGVIRSLTASTHEGLVRMGIQFSELDSAQHKALEFWLVAHNSQLREV